MMPHIILYTFLPMFAVWLASILTLTIKPKGVAINTIQAFSSGVLMAGISAELIPKIHFAMHPFVLCAGILVGLICMLGLNKLNPGCCGSKEKNQPLLPFITAFSVEFILTGILIILAGVVSQYASLVVATSMTICSLVCGMSVATRLISSGKSKVKSLFFAFLMSLLFPLAGWAMNSLLNYFSIEWIQFIIALGVGILLYLALMDLLTEALKSKNIMIKWSFFIGFVVILLIGTV